MSATGRMARLARLSRRDHDLAVSFEIPARAEFVALARSAVAAVAAADGGFEDARVADLQIAVSEACTNAIEAHRAVQSDERVTVRTRVDEHVLEVRIEDRGRGFDPATLPEHPPVTDPERLKFERGLGVPLIRSVVDEVEFSSTAKGTVVRLVVRRSALPGAEARSH